MAKIKSFNFNKQALESIKNTKYGHDWPGVYILENGKQAYIGESTNIYRRSRQHLKNEERNFLNSLHLISGSNFNKSVALDLESFLIEYMSADTKYSLQNGNSGMVNHNYYDKELYRAKFSIIWEELRKESLVDKKLIEIRNSDIFKYSPYKALTDDQLNTCNNILDVIRIKEGTILVNGGAGTGKTILAIYMMKYISHLQTSQYEEFTQEKEFFYEMKIGLVVPMTSLRTTLKKVFRHVKGLKSNMVMGPSEVVGKDYDILFVDEAHRLTRRVNLANMGSFDRTNRKLGLGNEGNQLNWIQMSSKYQILFYDEKQSIKPSDIEMSNFNNTEFIEFYLQNQMRIKGGNKYIDFVNKLFDLKPVSAFDFEDYDFRIFDQLDEMINVIRQKEVEQGLSRLVAGYAWKWKSKKNPNDFDIEVGNVQLRWNSTNKDWINSLNAINEVGCIRTVQGYDLNYIGIIIGPELSYDFVNSKFIVDKTKYKDKNGKKTIKSDEELLNYITNIYKVLMTRAIEGTFVYICDEDLRIYFKKLNLLE